MISPIGSQAAAVHIGADVLTQPEHARWARPLSCLDTVERLSRVCQAAGVGAQQVLLGPDATTGRACAAIAASVAGIGPGGLLVVTFSGHSERPVPGEHGGGWCLHDQVLRHAQTAGLLAAAPASAHIVIIADTCYAAACAAAITGVPATTIVLAACAENQATLNYQQSEFVMTLERLTYPGGKPNPDCASYAWLRRELRKDTPDVERPEVLASTPAAMRQRPFHPTPAIAVL
ncbi:MAG TPA: hypothetical protein VFI65_27570 [Streptosporangiaceae bacterium]|nr:hypothetical protein [Streptosporangiaceae bacterium]